jgi:hypothetical protein
MSSNLTGTGVVEVKTAGETLIFGSPVYFNSDSSVYNADAGVVGKYPCMGIVIDATIVAGTTGNILLGPGTIRNDSWAWAVGGSVYLASGGGLTQTPPKTIQVLGMAHPDSDTVLFRPSTDYVILN